jgi:DNA-binding MarR family transcriptional regulator
MTTQAEQLAQVLHTLIQVFLVAERSGAPAEGRLKFNPLHFHMLGKLATRGALRSSALAAALGVKRSTLSSAAERLASLGLLRRAEDPHDGRAVLFSLTAEGVATAEAIKRQDLRNAATLLDQLSMDERAAFVPLMVKVGDLLAAQLPNERSFTPPD